MVFIDILDDPGLLIGKKPISVNGLGNKWVGTILPAAKVLMGSKEHQWALDQRAIISHSCREGGVVYRVKPIEVVRGLERRSPELAKEISLILVRSNKRAIKCFLFGEEAQIVGFLPSASDKVRDVVPPPCVVPPIRLRRRS